MTVLKLAGVVVCGVAFGVAGTSVVALVGAFVGAEEAVAGEVVHVPVVDGQVSMEPDRVVEAGAPERVVLHVARRRPVVTTIPEGVRIGEEHKPIARGRFEPVPPMADPQSRSQPT